MCRWSTATAISRKRSPSAKTIISSGANLSQLNQSLVQALADAAVRDNDADIRALLAAQGITVKENAAAKPVAAAPAKAK